jgi:bifunctional non-homologous end joining protein LigD
MRAHQVRRAFTDPAWAFEVKYDGFRALAEWGRNGARLKSRQGRDITGWFGEIAMVLQSIGGRRCVVDGEICVLNTDGVAGDTEFRLLLNRAARRGYKPGDDLVDFIVFDVLVLHGRSIMHRPLIERRARLLELLVGLPHVHVIHQVRERGEEMYEAALGLGLEGIVAKRLDSPYQPGVRSKDWLKIKRPGAVPRERFR